MEGKGGLLCGQLLGVGADQAAPASAEGTGAT